MLMLSGNLKKNICFFRKIQKVYCKKKHPLKRLIVKMIIFVINLFYDYFCIWRGQERLLKISWCSFLQLKVIYKIKTNYEGTSFLLLIRCNGSSITRTFQLMLYQLNIFMSSFFYQQKQFEIQSLYCLIKNSWKNSKDAVWDLPHLQR